MHSLSSSLYAKTSTLTQGVNLGVSTVIVSETSRRVDGKWENMKLSDFRNLSGRAGRSFTDFEGKTIIVFDEAKIKKEEDFSAFIEKICSNSYAEDLTVKDKYEDCFDYFDDNLLSLLLMNELNTDDLGWLLNFFAKSLMHIECKYLEDAQIKHDRINRILISRTIGLKQKLMRERIQYYSTNDLSVGMQVDRL